jgi:hypothetical protein
LVDLARDLGVKDRSLFFHPPIARRQLASALSAATMLSAWVIPVPILEHNSGNKFFDAFAAGKPIAINYRGWHADLLEQSGAGVVLDNSDVRGAAASLVGCMHDTEWLGAAAAASRRLGDEMFERRRLAGRLEEVLRQSVSGRG